MNQVIVGISLPFVVDLPELVDGSTFRHSDFIAIPLFHPRYRRNESSIRNRIGPSTRSDMQLPNSVWTKKIVGLVSKWIDLESNHESERLSSEAVFLQDLEWAHHLGLQAVIIPTPLKLFSSNYARIIKSVCSKADFTHQQFWTHIPFAARFDAKSANTDNSFKIWDNFFNLLGLSPKVLVMIEIETDLPDNWREMLKLWKGQPVKAIMISTKTFIANRLNYPVLSKIHQEILTSFFDGKIHVLLHGQPILGDGYLSYIEYIRHLSKIASTPLSETEKFTHAYKDTLQVPLQPLMDNLESFTYDTFERDPIKYDLYEDAIGKALLKIKNDMMKESEKIVVFVAGAGRGPIVVRVFNAAKLQNASVKVYAVEKNPNAIITLRNRFPKNEWTDCNIIWSDMRKWDAPERADLIVSELLGSFGCNELSPECCDGIESYLKPNGIMIPAAYTSYLSPVSSTRNWMAARDMPNGFGLHRPFVVKLHRCDLLSDPLPIFTFIHPNIGKISNARYTETLFTVPYDTTIHGFQGMFSSDLFDGTILSIETKSHTPDMFSWFPIFFPLSQPVSVRRHEIVCVHFWRCFDERKVWYEWCLSSPQITEIQNSGGREFWIGH